MNGVPVRSGTALVLAQFVLLALILWPRTGLHASALAWGLLAAAGCLGAWTLLHNRPGNFNVRPEPRIGGRLITGGPYRYMRHPMYSALLLFAAAMAVAYADPWKIPVVLLLWAVLWAKAILEERHLRQHHPEYGAYATRVARFIPGLF